MTKEQFLSKVIFKDDNERGDALFYIEVKGEMPAYPKGICISIQIINLVKCWHISSLSDAEVQYLDKQKIQDLVGGSIYI